jgi:hypothetical protein
MTITTENYDDKTIYTRDELTLEIGRHGRMASVTLGRRGPTGRFTVHFNILVEPESRTVLARALAGDEYIVVSKSAWARAPANTRAEPDDEFWEATRAGAPTVVEQTRPPAGVLRFTVAGQPDADTAWAIARLIARKFYGDRRAGLSMTDVRTGVQRAFSPQVSFDCQFEARPGTAFELNRHGVREWEDGS